MPLTFEAAQELMGENAMSPGEVMKLMGVNYAGHQLRQLSNVPFLSQTLLGCKGTHLLFPGFPLDLREMKLKFSKTHLGDYKQFSRASVELKWYLLHTSLYAYTQWKGMDKQVRQLKAREYVPWSCEVVFMVLLAYLRTGQRLLPDVSVRCGDDCWGGFATQVGPFTREGLNIWHLWQGEAQDRIGLASGVSPDFSS
jgi:hypothetical protein